MIDLLIEKVAFKNACIDVAIDQGRILALPPAGTQPFHAKTRIDGSGKFLRAPFYNTHTHHAMTLLRGIDDNCSLMRWLHTVIWPREARLTAEAVYAGTRLAILESIKTGCVAFNDMYFHQPQILRAAREMGVRAQVGLMYMDQVSSHIENEATLALRESLPPTLHLAIAPHAIYTTTPQQLEQLATLAHDLQLPLHTHASETLEEVRIAQSAFGARSPIALLDRCGLLSATTILAHCCHLDDDDRALLAQRRCTIAHCPHSNLKLASGTFHFHAAHTSGIKITLGTDGAASNNSLSMLAETKTAALLAKSTAGRSDALPLSVIDHAVTDVAAAALGFPNAGKIEVGADADLLLIDLHHPAFIGPGDRDANFLYGADSSVIDTVICNGRILMQARKVEGEEEILAHAHRVALALQA